MAPVHLKCNKSSIYPIMGIVCGIFTIFITTIIWFSFDHFNEGWEWPPISLVGREVPSIYFFATGFTITSILLVKFSFVYMEYLSALEIKLVGSLLPENTWKRLTQVFMSIGGINLALMALTNHRDLWYKGILPHIVTTLVMFFASLIGCVSGYKALTYIRKNVVNLDGNNNHDASEDESKAHIIKYLDYIILIKKRLVLLLAFAVIIHVPCGYIFPRTMCRGTRSSISMDNCTRQYKLSEEYCRAWQDEDPSMTRFRYNDCSGWLTIGKHYSLVNILLHNFISFANNFCICHLECRNMNIQLPRHNWVW